MSTNDTQPMPKIIGRCGAPGCNEPIQVGVPHECLGVRAYRLAEMTGPEELFRFALLVGCGCDPVIARELLRGDD